MQLWRKAVLLVIGTGSLLCGCVAEPRVVLVPPVAWIEGKPTSLLKVGPDAVVRVYVWNGTIWELSANKVPIPEGWLVAAPPPSDGEEK